MSNHVKNNGITETPRWANISLIPDTKNIVTISKENTFIFYPLLFVQSFGIARVPELPQERQNLHLEIACGCRVGKKVCITFILYSENSEQFDFPTAIYKLPSI